LVWILELRQISGKGQFLALLHITLDEKKALASTR